MSEKLVDVLGCGNEVVLQKKCQTLAEVLRGLAPFCLEDAEAFDQAMAQSRTEPAQARDWDQLLGTSCTR